MAEGDTAATTPDAANWSAAVIAAAVDHGAVNTVRACDHSNKSFQVARAGEI
jgi:hypothetical protein